MKVLFICKGNWFRSQMAAAIYNKLTNTHDAFSAGTYTGAPDEPEGLILSNIFKSTSPFLEVMDRNGINIRDNVTTRLTPCMIEESNLAVSMAEEPYIPDFLKNNPKVIVWDIENPEVITKEIAEDTYKRLEMLIQDLINE